MAAPSTASLRPPVTDLDRAPIVVAWEVTRACGYRCVHCRADAQPRRSPRELDLAEGMRMIDDLAAFDGSILVLTGGDPLTRPDLEDLTAHATRRGLRVALTPSATPRVTDARIRSLAAAGVRRVALSLDGATAATHDGMRRLPGSYARTLGILESVRDAGLPIQVNSTITRATVGEIDQLAEVVAGLGPAMWSVFFLVSVGRGREEDMLSPAAHEEAFERLADLDERLPFRVKVTEAPPFRRVLAQRAARRGTPPPPDQMVPVRDGQGFMFVSHEGDVCPSGFLPVSAGNVRDTSPVAIYRDSELFRSLRDADRLGGKCGRCGFRRLCGGSRARAWALGGDPLGEDPTCIHEPPPATDQEETHRC
ncbi:MAG: radical SAM protein [Actinomycetota bacterium]